MHMYRADSIKSLTLAAMIVGGLGASVLSASADEQLVVSLPAVSTFAKSDVTLGEAVKYIQSHRASKIDGVTETRVTRTSGKRQAAQHTYILGGAEAFPM
jgi:hypothetical protein